MAEEFDELPDDEITTVTLTYTDDLIVPEIADREGIYINQVIAGSQEYSCSEKGVMIIWSSYSLPRLPERIYLNFLYKKTQKMIIFKAKWRPYDSNYCQRVC